MVHILGPAGVLGDSPPFISLLSGYGGAALQPHQIPPLNCIFWEIPFTNPFLVVTICPVPFLGRDLLAQVGVSICFAPPIHLTLDLSAASLLLLATHPIGSNMSFPLPVFQVDPQNPSIARNHPPIHPHPIIGPYIVCYPSPVANPTPELLISDPLRKKNYVVLHPLLLTPQYLQLRNLEPPGSRSPAH